ncbi:MAG: Smr/MutS family protein [Pyrinomonadaceae bacterium]
MKFIDWLRDRFGSWRTTARANSDPSAGIDEMSDVDPYNPFPEIVEIAITDVSDLHTIPPRDVARVVEEYLEQVHQAGFPAVRIIHGKGIGVQREMVRSILARTPFVSEWADAPPEAGGIGATIVRLKSAGF